MALNAELTDAAIAASRQNVVEASDALSRALGSTIQIDPAGIVAIDLNEAKSSWQSPGLAIVLKLENEAVLGFIPESSHILPTWYRSPDATGVSKLTTLAQELGMVLLPEDQMPLDFAAGFVENFADAMRKGGCEPQGGIAVPLSDATSALLFLLWPATSPDQVLAKTTAPVSENASPKATTPESHSEATEGVFDAAIPKLPPYIRSLLQIKTAVAVQLASCKQPVSRIIEMGPGSIVQFNRQCEQPLELFVNNLKIAEGEVVKVGDKFGLRITQMHLPQERFLPMQQLALRTRLAS
jgi:flagellar motor switch protein FliN